MVKSKPKSKSNLGSQFKISLAFVISGLRRFGHPLVMVYVIIFRLLLILFFIILANSWIVISLGLPKLMGQ